MTDDEILDECRRRFAACAAQEIVWDAIDKDMWNRYANAAYGFSDTGDETSPSESNPVPIEDVYAPEEKIESEEERRERLWKAVQVSSIT